MGGMEGGIGSGPGYQYSTTDEGAQKLENDFNAEAAQNKSAKETLANAERKEKFDKIQVGAMITVKDEEGNLVQRKVTKKLDDTMEVEWESEVGVNATFGGRESMDAVLGIMNPKTQN